ncbi:MAG: membrane dipeptidase [Bryobacterales bacterium]|nr:membrane dipeptidase [Bryobacterales bacterium]
MIRTSAFVIAASTWLLPLGSAQDDLHSESFVMDAHVHLMTRSLLEGLDIGDRVADGHVDLPRLAAGGIDAVFFSVYTPEAYYPARYEVKNTFRVVSLALDQIERNSDRIELALDAEDIRRIAASGKIAAFLDLEGPFDLDGDLHVLRALHRLGLRSAQLTAHNFTNEFADSCCDISKWGGINEHGRAVIREMNRLGMVINVAHGSTETILQAADASEDPVVYTHGGFRSIIDIERLISDEAAKAVAAKGGVIALQFGNSFNNPEYFKWKFDGPLVANVSTKLDRFRRMPVAEIDAAVARGLPFVTDPSAVPERYRMGIDQLARNIEFGVRLVGEDHIALGSDFDGGPLLPREMRDASDYGEVTKALLRLGYGEERIRKILGGNLLRVIEQVTAK